MLNNNLIISRINHNISTIELFSKTASINNTNKQESNLISLLSASKINNKTLIKKSLSIFNTKSKIKFNENIGNHTPFCKIFIIRGIGYRASILENVNASCRIDFNYKRYLSVRVGHSYYLYLQIPESIGIKILKKDRKVILYGFNKSKIMSFANKIYNLRRPSIYTGRGIRKKKVIHTRKLGKKDLRKGKAF